MLSSSAIVAVMVDTGLRSADHFCHSNPEPSAVDRCFDDRSDRVYREYRSTSPAEWSHRDKSPLICSNESSPPYAGPTYVAPSEFRNIHRSPALRGSTQQQKEDWSAIIVTAGSARVGLVLALTNPGLRGAASSARGARLVLASTGINSTSRSSSSVTLDLVRHERRRRSQVVVLGSAGVVIATPAMLLCTHPNTSKRSA
jgi:hypothetical protein